MCLEAYAVLGGSRAASDLRDASYGLAMPEAEASAHVYAATPAYAVASSSTLAGMMVAGEQLPVKYAQNAISVEPTKPAKRRCRP